MVTGMEKVYLIGGLRSHIGLTGGMFKTVPAEELAACYRDAGAPVQVVEDYRAAIDAAMEMGRAQGRPVIITGSLYLVGAARTYLMQSR